MDELLKIYRATEARCEYLKSQIGILEESLEKNRREMVSDKVSMSQAISGMPHGTSPGDPCGNLALDLAMGNVSVFVKQIMDELVELRTELNSKGYIIVYVNSWLKSLSDREKAAVELKALDQQPWAMVVMGFRDRFGGPCSKHTVQRLYDRAMEKIYETAA